MTARVELGVGKNARFSEDELLKLPFDQYGRHRIVQRVAERVRRTHGHASLDVLDVGGFPCLTPQFLLEDRVVVIDLPHSLPATPRSAGDVPRPDSAIRNPQSAIHNPHSALVWADGCALPFRAGAFHLVVSLDCLEHVPGERRRAYVSELLRVSSGYVLILAPFASDGTMLAEQIVAEFVRVVNREEQPQLREHRAYGLPGLDEWLAFFQERGLACVSFASGFLYNWLPMMLIKHFLLSLPDSDTLHRAVDRFYNLTLQASDARTPGYRQGILVSTGGPSPVLAEVSELLAPTGQADRLEVIERMQQIALLLQLADLHVASRRDDRLRDEIAAKEQHIRNLEAQAAADRARADAVEAHLAAMRGGRVMRLLAAVDRALGRGP